MNINTKLRKSSSMILALGLFISCISTSNVYAGEREVVNVEKLNVRKGPSVYEEKIGSLDKGMVVEVLETVNGWDKIKLIDGKEGWVSSNYTEIEEGTIMNVEATAYAGDSITSTGTIPKWGTIAVDPTVIPYGTKVYIPKFDMVFTAEDCGSAIKSKRIDIFMNSESECVEFGRQNIEIKILK